jgi:hypothetical protein
VKVTAVMTAPRRRIFDFILFLSFSAGASLRRRMLVIPRPGENPAKKLAPAWR